MRAIQVKVWRLGPARRSIRMGLMLAIPRIFTTCWWAIGSTQIRTRQKLHPMSDQILLGLRYLYFADQIDERVTPSFPPVRLGLRDFDSEFAATNQVIRTLACNFSGGSGRQDDGRHVGRLADSRGWLEFIRHSPTPRQILLASSTRDQRSSRGPSIFRPAKVPSLRSGLGRSRPGRWKPASEHSISPVWRRLFVTMRATSSAIRRTYWVSADLWGCEPAEF